MRRFALTFIVASIVVAVLAPMANAKAVLSCRKTGGDSGTYAQPLPPQTTLTYKLKDVMVSS